jgi:hypothetical protein
MDAPGASLCEGDKTGMFDCVQSKQDTDWADHQWQLKTFIVYYILFISTMG